MKNNTSLVESLHRLEHLKKGDVFLKYGKPCTKIGMLQKGVMRGFVYDTEGNEVTTHFYQEGDMIIGTYIPNVNLTMTIEAIEECTISIANYSEIMSLVNVNMKITEIITREFQKLNNQLQSRLVALLNLSSVKKYALFLDEYPNLINRIPHYYIAQYLGVTPTQLSRARREFVTRNKD
ncbi:MAG: Crp/Fnr family transcriptional regulator [Aureispira sp.]|nr:Crp/Fnr family transcriptional regulator [Aureispira sp.]